MQQTSWIACLTAVALIVSLCGVAAPARDGGQKPWELLAELNEELFDKERADGPFEFWTLAEKYEWGQKERAVGFQSPDLIHGLPGDGDIAVADAIEIAREAMQTVPISPYAMMGFEPLNICFNVVDPERPVWLIDFMADCGSNYWSHCAIEIDARTGDVLSTPNAIPPSYSPEPTPEPDEKAAMAFMEWEQQQLSEKGPMEDWSVEDRYRWQQRWNEVWSIVSIETQFALPSDDHLPQEEAFRLAVSALCRKYPALTEQTLTGSRYHLITSFYANDLSCLTGRTQPMWEFCFNDTKGGKSYRVRIEAATGRVTDAYGGEKGWG